MVSAGIRPFVIGCGMSARCIAGGLSVLSWCAGMLLFLSLPWQAQNFYIDENALLARQSFMSRVPVQNVLESSGSCQHDLIQILESSFDYETENGNVFVGSLHARLSDGKQSIVVAFPLDSSSCLVMQSIASLIKSSRLSFVSLSRIRIGLVR